MLRAHKIKLNPTDEQMVYFAKACGVARHAYNWALAEWQQQYEAGGKPNEAALRKQYNAIKPVEFPWALEVTKCAPQQAIKNAGVAYQNFFRRVKQGVSGRKAGYPNFKKKGVHESFRADNGPQRKGESAVPTDGKRIKLPIIGWVKMREEIRFDGCIQSTTVSQQADGWYITVVVETNQVLERTADRGVAGVDLGVKAMATLSTGEVVDGPKPHKVLDARLRRLNRSLARKEKGSANFKKAKKKLAKLHKRMADIRGDATHKLSHELATEFNVIGLEDLNVSGMTQNHRLARSIADQAFSQLRAQVEYKAAMTGAEVVIVDRWFPSSRRCSNCGQLHDMPLSVRTLQCDCGVTIDRDLNAAINIAKYAASSAVSACGEESAGVEQST